MAERPYDINGSIIAYERGELTNDETSQLVRYLVDTGIACMLPGPLQKNCRSVNRSGLHPD
jgi:hypothetical protein